MKGGHIQAWYPLVHGNKELLNNLVFKESGKKYVNCVQMILLALYSVFIEVSLPKL
jgi:diketogulonate reductase-like aldo/keto reductase